MTREERVVILLESRTAWIAGPRSQFATFGAVAGELPTEREKCRPCLGLGLVSTRKGVERCENCAGRGWYLIDSYTRARRAEPARRAGMMSGSDRSVWRATLDAAIASTRAFTHRPPAVRSAADLADVKPDRWEAERDRHYRAGDYQVLADALELMKPLARTTVIEVYEYRTFPPSATSRAALNQLLMLMPERIRVPHWLIVTDESEAYNDRVARRS